MSGIEVVFPFEELNAAADKAALDMLRSRREVLDVLGIQLLSFAQEAYVAKARGGTGSDGIQWDWIQAGTLLARMRRAGHLVRPGVKNKKNTVGPKAAGLTQFMQIKQPGGKKNEAARKANNSVFRRLASSGVIKATTSGKGDARFKTGSVIGIVKDKKTGSTKETLRKRISPSGGGYEIGVDTGMQRSSAQPGYTGRDGKGGNVKKIDGDTLTVGFGRNYSEYFDEKRALFPVKLPQEWLDDLEEMAAQHGADIIERSFKESGVT